eukprot:TRINITY_DN1218_c0_g2_i1.p1 TRINITY_DN1218_c0_g2~~TRINITY_DN1218_c0_g2_i1.p1  ORF type:complete len:374 (+),score=82.53 TRINITY_DN1218_c0_g2_i1:79-1122(+)
MHMHNASCNHSHSHSHNHNHHTMAQTMIIKDPFAKTHISYEVPLSQIERTAGFDDHYNAMLGGEKKSGHRACLCGLFLRGRCGQGSKCKSFHVNKEFVDLIRKKNGVEVEDNFMREVVVRNTITNRVFAVRFTAVLRTRALDKAKRNARAGRVAPINLCRMYNPGLGKTGVCSDDRNCEYIHVKHSELRDLDEYRLRTPCCGTHGDRGFTKDVSLCGINIPSDRIAQTAGSESNSNQLCTPHFNSRCKFGRSCPNLHVCRDFVSKHQELKLVATTMPPSIDDIMSVSPSSSSNISPSSTPPVDEDDMPPLVDEEQDVPYFTTNVSMASPLFDTMESPLFTWDPDLKM